MQIWIYWTGFLLYAAIVLAIGWRGYRRGGPSTQADADFWAAGKALGPWATGLSISASFMSISWSCVYAVQLAYWYGLSAIWLLAVPWLTVMAIYYVLTPYFRRLPAFSQPEMLAQRFGARVRVYFALPLAFVFLIWGGAEIYAAAQILAPILRVPFHFILALIAVIVAAYSFMGGFAAVVTTDKVQFVLVAFFIVTISWVAVNAVGTVDSFASFVSNLPAPPMTQAPVFSLFAAGFGLIVVTLIAYLPGWVIETDIWLRLQASKSDRTARQGVLIATLNSLVFIAVLPMLIGITSLYLYPPQGAEIPEILNDGAAIISVLINNHTPTALSVALIVGLAAASMSTIDTCGNVVALSLSYDVVEPLLERRKVTVNRKTVARVFSAGAVMLAYVYAIFTESLWDIFYLSSGVLTTTIFIPMVALFTKNAQTRQVQAAAVVGFATTIAFYFMESHGALAVLEPDWLAKTGLGYILWSFLCSFTAFILLRKNSAES